MRLRLREKVHPYLSIAVLVWAVATTGVITYVHYEFTQTESDQTRFLSSPQRGSAQAASSTER